MQGKSRFTLGPMHPCSQPSPPPDGSLNGGPLLSSDHLINAEPWEAFRGRNGEKAEPGKRLQILQTRARNDISQCKQSLISPPPPRWGFPA